MVVERRWGFGRHQQDPQEKGSEVIQPGVASSLALILTVQAYDCSKSNLSSFQGRKAFSLRMMVAQLIRAKLFTYITRSCIIIDVTPLVAQTVFSYG